ncbi:MAG: hypothetical protein AAGH42_05300 [Pseudomonadota bacterium]
MSAFLVFPLMTISFVVYAVITVTGVGDIVTSTGTTYWHEIPIAELELYSGDRWPVTWGVLFLVISMGLLFVELVRATKIGNESVFNHVLSFLVFTAAAFAFVLVEGFGNTTFFIFLLMLFLDPITGIIVTTATTRRDLAVTDTVVR